MKRALFVSTTLLLLCFSAQTQTATPDDGEVKNGVYYNTFFNLSFKYPKDWVVHEEAINKRIEERAKEAAQSPAELSALKNTYLLFTASRHPRGTPGIAMNPTILVAAEKIAHLPGQPDAKDYLLSLRPQKVARGVKVVKYEPTEFRVAGMQFFRDDYSGEVSGVAIKQALFVTAQKGYALIFSFNGDDQKSVDEMVQTMNAILPLGEVKTGTGSRP